MFTKFPSLVLISTLLAALAVAALAQPAGDPASPRSGSPVIAEPGLGASPVSGPDATAETPDQLMRRALAAFELHRSFSARLRYQVALFGQKLVGKGTYFQLGYGFDKRLRVETSIKASGKGAASQLTQVCDGRTLWMFEEVAGKSKLSLVDLRRVRRAMEEAKPNSTAPIRTPPNLSLGTGGLGRLLGDLNEQFEMYAARADQIGSDPVWIVDGRWRTQRLLDLLPKQADKIRAGRSANLDLLPHHLPHEVRITLSRDAALLPYRVEFVRTKQGDDGEKTNRVAIVAMEIYEIKVNEALDPKLFVYKPGSVDTVDQTEKFLIQRGLSREKESDGKR